MKAPDHTRRSFLKTAAITTAGLSSPALANTVEVSVSYAAGPRDMPQKELGNTGVRVPILQLGTSQRMDNVYDKVMHRCVKEGVTWIDTALSYGWGASHQAISNFINQIKDRKKIWITSKSGSSSPRGLSKGLDQALNELRTDYLDLFLMHGIDDTAMLDSEFIKLGDQLRKSGKINFFGFSCHDGNVVDLMNTAAKVGGIDAILFRYNFRRYGDRELNLSIDACKKAGIGLMAMKTMGSVPRNLEKVVQFRSQNFTLGQAKLKSVWADERIDTLVSEMDSVGTVKENVSAAKTEKPLTAEESHQLNQLAALTANYACNGCSHICQSAIKGNTAISESLRYLMYFESYGKQERARELYKAMPTESRYFDLADLKNASAVCPQGIDIAARLDQARTLLEA